MNETGKKKHTNSRSRTGSRSSAERAARPAGKRPGASAHRASEHRAASASRTRTSKRPASSQRAAQSAAAVRKPRFSKKYKRYFAVLAGALVIAVIAAIVMAVIYFRRAYNEEQAHKVDPLTVETIRATNIKNADKLMIVAHPDDESIWGGGHLQEGGYLVVCITNGRNEERTTEFKRAVLASGNTPLILEYPDKVNGERDNWDAVYDQIQHDVDLLVSYKSWTLIVSHNPLGEYGHQHHWMTSRIVADSCIKYGRTDILYYFGIYHSKGDLPDYVDEMTPMTDEQIEFKEYLLTFYDSQESTVKKFEHMNPYEMWLKADEVEVR